MSSPWEKEGTASGFTPLVGKFFVTSGNNFELNNQGVVKGVVNQEGYYLVVLFSWLTCGENGEHIVHFDDIAKYFQFTGNQEQHLEFCDNKKKVFKPGYDVGRGAR